jgi:hypothetical protein
MRPTVSLQVCSLLPLSEYAAEEKNVLKNNSSLLTSKSYIKENEKIYPNYSKPWQLRHAAAASGKSRLMEL